MIEVDGGLIEVDGGLIEVDGGLIEVNGGLMAVDGESMEVDGGMLEVDRGMLVENAGKRRELHEVQPATRYSRRLPASLPNRAVHTPITRVNGGSGTKFDGRSSTLAVYPRV